MAGTGSQDPLAVYVGSDPNRVDLVSDLKTVSGLHLRFFWYPQGNSYYVEDLGSTNGTYINGEKLQPNSPIAVAVGDQIYFGKTHYLTFEASTVAKLSNP